MLPVASMGLRFQKTFSRFISGTLFALRFELFQLGVAGHLPFQSAAYRNTELLFNALLRFADRVTLATYILSKAEQEETQRHKDYVDPSRLLSLQISQLEPGVLIKVTRMLGEASRAIFLYIGFSSLLYLPVLAIAYAGIKLGFWRTATVKERLSNVIEREAYRAEARRSLRPEAA